MNLKLLIVAAAMSLSGCAYVEKQAADHYNVWVGHPADELKIAWGAPRHTTPLSSGGEVLTYKERECTMNVAVHDNTVSKLTYNSVCTARYIYSEFPQPTS